MKQHIKRILHKQKEFFAENKTKKYGFRMKALERLDAAIDQYEEQLYLALKKDLGKSRSESYMTEIMLIKTEITFVRKNLHRWMKPKNVKATLVQQFAKSYIVKEPYGVVLVMAPWNYPLLLCLLPMIDAIAAGNCVFIKSSEYVPNTSRVLNKMIKETFSEKYITLIEGGIAVNEALLEQRFDYIFFTGGAKVGKIVLEKAARNLTPVTLELGGKSPCIVDETANLDTAAKRIAFGKVLNAGQTCVAPDYILVHHSVHNVFIEKLAHAFACLLGEAGVRNKDYPKIVNQRHYKRLVKLMEGQHIAAGGEKEETMCKIAPTILTNVDKEARIMQEEIFGPLLPVLTYHSKTDIKEIIKAKEKPLALYLFTQGKAMENWVTETFSFGGGCINDTMIHLASPRIPFGGVGASGMGEYHGKYGFDTFSHKKSIVKRPNRPEGLLAYHPYKTGENQLIRWITKHIL